MNESQVIHSHVMTVFADNMKDVEAFAERVCKQLDAKLEADGIPAIEWLDERSYESSPSGMLAMNLLVNIISNHMKIVMITMPVFHDHSQP